MYKFKLGVLVAFGFFGLFIFISQSDVVHVAGSVRVDSLSAPTSVSASDAEYANKIGVRWDTIRDATLYRVYRNTTNNGATATDVGTTQANYFFDPTAVYPTLYYYWVRAESGATLSALSSPDQGVVAQGDVGPGPFPPLEPPPAPAGNSVTAARSYLGKALFWDEQLSSTKTVACGTCHRPATGGSDPRTVFGDARSRNPGFDATFFTADDVYGSPGVPLNSASGNYSPAPFYGLNEQVTGRKSPTYLNAGYATNGLFWDGRATDAFRDQLTNNILLTSSASLESQSAGPPLSSAEMAHGGRNWTQVAARVQVSRPLALASNIPSGLKTWIGSRMYPELFQEAFGSPDVTPARISMAIGTHERTLFSDNSPLDKWGANIAQLTQSEENGRDLFLVLQCAICHQGTLMSDHQYHNIGVRPVAEDRGRGAITSDPADDGAFKTPNLRNVELHPPYMHNGRFNTLEEVVDFYNRGGDFDAPNVDHQVIRQLNLTPELKADLVAFLKRPLTDLRVKNELPPFDRPQLYTESARVPLISGTGRAGSASTAPVPVAIEPSLLGNPNFTLAVTSSLKAANAVVVIDQADPGIVAAIPASGSFARVATPLVQNGNGGYASVNIAIPNDSSLVGRTFYGRWYIQDIRNRKSIGISKMFSFTVFRAATDPLSVAPFDFDGDGKSDMSVYRQSEGKWAIRNSSSENVNEISFGLAGDRIVPADYDGDGRADIGVYRGGTWYILRSSQGSTAQQFGLAGDIPQPGDYDGDGRADLAVFRPSTGVWYVLQTSTGFKAYAYGLSTDKPIAADYDGDGRMDLAVFRDGVWFVNETGVGSTVTSFGLAGDRPVVGDYDGDGKADIAVWRPSDGTWYYRRSSDGPFAAVKFGMAGDIPSPGDYDGDGRSDPAVFRNGMWYVYETSTGSARIEHLGVTADASVPAAYVP